MTEDDYRSLEKCYVSQRYADAAQIRRVDSLEGRERVGRNGAGDYAGLLFAYTDPVTKSIVGERLRLDHPPFDSKGKPKHKYLSPPGQRMHFYWPFADPAWLDDFTMPIVVVEGEKKYLAAHRAAFEKAVEGKPLYFVIALAGVWAWLGKTGIATNEKGKRVDVKGVIPDFDRVVWKGRRVVIFFDSNVLTNDQVSRARNQLARELASRGALVFIVDLPGDVGGVPVNGLDDFLAAAGLEPFVELFQNALRWDWRTELHRNEKGKIRTGGIHNALVALRYAPELHGIVIYNQFANRPEIRKRTPWNSEPGQWRNHDDTQLRDWLETRGIYASSQAIADVVQAYSIECGSYHPVRDYLESLKWDGTGRIDDWLVTHAGADQGDPERDGDEEAAKRASLVREFGAKWLIGAVARIFEPGCKADYLLLLEGDQGIGKTRLLATLGGEFYTDDIPDLRSKDAQLNIEGVWIVEFSELNSITRAENEHCKAFLTRTTDRFRSPYERRPVDHPRQCVFAGSTNRTDWGNDETGLRRYWPVSCKTIRLDLLKRDRDQLWAEAVARYRKGEKWWIEAQKMIDAAKEAQESRQRSDPWDQIVGAYHNAHGEALTTTRVLVEAVKKDQDKWAHADTMRVAAILTRLGRKSRQMRVGGVRCRVYYIPKSEEEGEPTE